MVKKSKKMMGLRKLEVLGTFMSAMLHLSVTPKSVTEESTICTEKAEEKVMHETVSKCQKSFK